MQPSPEPTVAEDLIDRLERRRCRTDAVVGWCGMGAFLAFLPGGLGLLPLANTPALPLAAAAWASSWSGC